MPAYGATRKLVAKSAHATTYYGVNRTIKRPRNTVKTAPDAIRDAIKRDPAAHLSRQKAIDAEMRVSIAECGKAADNVRATMTHDEVIQSYLDSIDGFHILPQTDPQLYYILPQTDPQFGSRIATRAQDINRALKSALTSDIDGFMQTAVKQRLNDADKWEGEEWSKEEAERTMNEVRRNVQDNHVARSV